jgi:alpha-ketoglutarate-dependent taurine dioxygenase
MSGRALDETAAWWRARLLGAPALELPTDRPRPPAMRHRGARRNFTIGPATSAAVRELARKEGVTPFVVLLSGFEVVLHRLSRQQDIVLGTGVAGRTRSELEPLIGFFVNLLPLRMDLSGDPSVRELLQRVSAVTTAALSHQEIPFDRLVEAINPPRQLDRAPLFQVVFALNNAPTPALALGGVRIDPVAIDDGTAKFDLTMLIDDGAPELSGLIEFDTDLFDAATVEGWLANYLRVLDELTATPTVRLGQLGRASAPPTARTGAAVDFRKVKPKPVATDELSLVRMTPVREGVLMPLLIEPMLPDLNIIDWMVRNAAVVKDKLARHGAILFRGVPSVTEFERAASGVIGDLFPGSGELVRSHVTGTGQIYTPVEFPATLPILWHSENTFKHEWPLKIFFYCARPADEGGDTPLVDTRLLYQQMPLAIRDHFERTGIMYVRNYGEGLGLSWQQVFQVQTKSELESLLRRTQVGFEWHGERLRTWTVRPAVMKHPLTGEQVWVNQATHWHVSFLPEEVRRPLLDLYSVDALPRHCFYGDGSTITDDQIAQITEVYRRTEVSSPWRPGDAVLCDNLLVAHARNPYRGDRKVYVAMGQMYVP